MQKHLWQSRLGESQKERSLEPVSFFCVPLRSKLFCQVIDYLFFFFFRLQLKLPITTLRIYTPFTSFNYWKNRLFLLMLLKYWQWSAVNKSISLLEWLATEFLTLLFSVFSFLTFFIGKMCLNEYAIINN